jgi:hypothetical protein
VLADSATYAVGSGDVEEGLAVAVADGLGEAEGVEATGEVEEVADVVEQVVVAVGLLFEVGVLDVQEAAASDRLTAIAGSHKKYFFMKFSLDN